MLPITRMLNDPFFGLETEFPLTDIIEKGDSLEFHVEMPGFKKEEIKIELKDGTMLISAEHNEEHKEEKDGKTIYSQRNHSSLSRQFRIPGSIKEEDIVASLEDGVLKIVAKKSEEEKKLIEIK